MKALHIPDPARQGDDISLADWLRFHIGAWMKRKGADLEHRALYPEDIYCNECGCMHRPDFECDGIPF